MKNLVLSMLAIASITAMNSCSSESDPIDEAINAGNQEKVEIKLSAGVVGVETKAQVVPGDDITTFAGQQVPLFRINSASTADWTTVGDAVEATINGTTVTLGDAHKYYDGENKAFFIGYYSAITPTRTKNVLTFTGVDGTKDIICTDETDAGSKTSTDANAVLTFNHIVSKVAIKVAGTAAAQKAFGKITKIDLLQIPTSIDVTLGSTLSIAANTTTPVLTDIPLYEAVDKANGYELPATPTTIGATPIIFNGGTTTPYGTNGKPLNIKVYTENQVGGLEVKIQNIEGGLELGKTHTITLTFKDRIGVTSSITGWGDSVHEGSDEIE